MPGRLGSEHQIVEEREQIQRQRGAREPEPVAVEVRQPQPPQRDAELVVLDALLDLRALAMVALHADGVAKEIAARLDTAPEVVAKWRRRFCEEGVERLKDRRARVARVVFPPQEVAQVKAVACELPSSEGVPLSRFSRAELHRLVIERGVTEASASTIARWLVLVGADLVHVGRDEGAAGPLGARPGALLPGLPDRDDAQPGEPRRPPRL